ncbi:MAG TPA: hypothetical protein VME20_04330 [Acidimicrobiales bacterium]|nr:hypothetical protein [Acidimicrobiales bacterium]
MTTVDAPATSAPPQPGTHHHMPTFGFTRWGHPVHARTVDHLPDHNAYARFNKRLALFITQNIGTMTCFWLFCVISLSSLTAVLYEAHIINTTSFLTANGFILVVSWLSQNFIQLVLLPALMVGQNLQNIAADARSAKTFEDVERIIDLLDCHTQGGLADIMEEVQRLRVQLSTANGGS